MFDKFNMFIEKWSNWICSEKKSFLSNLYCMLSLPFLIVLSFIYSVFAIILKYIKGGL